jgi:hypothetical protein
LCTACSRATVKAITGMAIANITINRVTTTALHRSRLAAGTGCT